MRNKLKNDMVFLGEKYRFPAFTLAEVLITLVIIGVIAAITVPAMIQQTQKQEYVSGLKKAYSTLQNALYRMADNNGYPHGDYTFLKKVNVINEFSKVLNVVKKCNSTSECFPSQITSGQYKLLNGSINNVPYGDSGAIITNDGVMYTFSTTASTLFGISEEDKANNLARIIVDLNGWKKPNQWGYDTFMFYLIDGKGVIPAGTIDTSDCVKNNNGFTCAAKVLKESKIAY